jgi:hypothetical protein
MVLFISLFLYFRQKIIALEEKLALLSDLTTTMAGITTLQRPTVCKQVEAAESEEDEPEEDEGSDEEGSEVSYSSSEDESVSVEELYDTSPVMTFVKVDSDMKNVIVMNESPPFESFLAPQSTEGFYPMELLAPEVLPEVKSVSLEALAPLEVKSVPLEVLSAPEVKSVSLEVLAPLEVKSVPLEVLSAPEVKSVPLELSSPEVSDVDVGLPKRVVSTDNVKTLTLDSPYDGMSLKELKEKVAETNGPKLKTKKELIDYLKNKM